MSKHQLEEIPVVCIHLTMSATTPMRSKFKFSARVEYVTEELDHSGNLFYMFNIKVTAEQDGILSDPRQWSVIKSEDEFLQTHKVLRKKYGLLKDFQFRNPSTVGSNMFHLTNAVKPRREKKDEYLTAILQLEPIPDEISAFLCLDNASYFTTKADGTAVLEGSAVVPTIDHATAMTPNPCIAAQATPVPTPDASPIASVVGTPVHVTERRTAKQFWLNFGLIVSCLVMLSSAWFISTIMTSVGKATGMSNADSVVMVLYRVLGERIHHHLILLRARLEVVVIVAALLAYTHRVLGYALGWYLRSKLDPTRSGKFNFHFDWIALRLGLDHNMLVISGVEWRNPPMFKHTPYLLRISEISVVVDAMSVYRAIKNNEAIRVKEIRFNKVVLHMEKLTSKVEVSTEKTTIAEIALGAGGEGASVEGSSEKSSPSRTPMSKSNSVRLDGSGAEPEEGGVAVASAAATTAVTLKPGVLNLWAAMGATNSQQEASMLTNVSGQMNAAVDGTTSMVSVLSSAVAKYNPASFLLKGGMSVGSTIGSTLGSTLGAGVGLLRGNSARKSASSASHATAEAAESASEEAAMKSALEDSINELACAEGDGEDSEDEGGETPQSSAARASVSNDTGKPAAAGTAGGDTSSSIAVSTTSTAAAAADPKKGFGFPYLLEIDALQLDRLELHTQDFLNAHHASDMSASVIKLKSLSMSYRDLTKPPKNTESSGTKGNDAAAGKGRNKRRPLYLDDVVWRLVNKLLAELLKNNSIAMMVLLSSAAANNTASVVSSAGSLAYQSAATGGKVVSSAGSLAYQGAATGGKLLSSVGSVFVGKTAAPSAEASSATTSPAGTPSRN